MLEIVAFIFRKNGKNNENYNKTKFVDNLCLICILICLLLKETRRRSKKETEKIKHKKINKSNWILVELNCHKNID